MTANSKYKALSAQLPIEIRRKIELGLDIPEIMKPSKDYKVKTWTVRVHEFDRAPWTSLVEVAKKVKHPRSLHYGVRDSLEKVLGYWAENPNPMVLQLFGLHSQVIALTPIIRELRLTTYPLFEHNALDAYKKFCDNFDDGLRGGELLSPQVESEFLQFVKEGYIASLMSTWDEFRRINSYVFDESLAVMVPSFEEFLSGCLSFSFPVGDPGSFQRELERTTKTESKPGVWRKLNWRPLPPTIRD
jgi:hypothetical protein